MNRKNATMFLIVIATLLAATFYRKTIESRELGAIVLDGNGRQITSLFADSNHELLKPKIIRQTNKLSCSKSNRIWSWFAISSVQAANCSPSNCSGTYMVAEGIPCPQNCSTVRNQYAWDPMIGDPNTGSRYDGNSTCQADDSSGNCSCLEVSCPS